MKTKISITACLIFISLGVSAQNIDLEGWIDGWRELSETADRNINWIGEPGESDLAGSLWSHRRRDVASPSLWQSGTVLFEDGARFDGPLRYDRARKIVQVQVGGKTRVYRESHISKLEIFEESPDATSANFNSKRKKAVYYSLPYAGEKGSQTPKLFELIVKGNTSLLSRWVKGNVFYSRKLYLINPKGKITEIKRRRGSVIKGFDNKHTELKSIVKQERLNMYDIRHVIKLVESYNLLISK